MIWGRLVPFANSVEFCKICCVSGEHTFTETHLVRGRKCNSQMPLPRLAMMAAGSDVLAAGADELLNACSRHAAKDQLLSIHRRQIRRFRCRGCMQAGLPMKRDFHTCRTRDICDSQVGPAAAGGGAGRLLGPRSGRSRAARGGSGSPAAGCLPVGG